MNAAETLDIYLSGEDVDWNSVDGGTPVSLEDMETLLEDAVERALRAGRTRAAVDLLVELDRLQERRDEEIIAKFADDPAFIGLSVDERVDAALADLGIDGDSWRL
jgi:hypothetical protein